MTHALRPGFLEQQPLWITVLDLLPVSLLALAVSVEGFPKPPISAEGAIAAFESALGLLGFLLWKRWMGIELAVFSLFPLALLPAFDEITTAYKTPFIFLSTLVIAAGALAYQRWRDARSWNWLILVATLVVAWLLAAHAAGAFWNMVGAMHIGECFLDQPGCPALTGNETPWWVLFLAP